MSHTTEHRVKEQAKNTGSRRLLTSILLFAIGFTFVLYGIHRNEHVTVQNKSNIICLECIGIG